MELYQEQTSCRGTCNKVMGGGGSECWTLPLTLKYKKNPIQFTTIEYNFCKPEAPEAKKLKDEIP